MSRRTLAAGVVVAGGLLVLAAAVAALSLAAFVVTPFGAWLLYGALVGGLALILVGGFGVDVEPRTLAEGGR
ncbi:MAG: hypothetical protein ACRCZP_15470 [Phycicoccus sp.]